ncbi:MAG: hypothetical protein ACP5FL_09545, partial [Thermoplasmatota archaeon]
MSGNYISWNGSTLEVKGNIYLDNTIPPHQVAVTENDITTISKPGGATYSHNGAITGAIVITLPQSWTSTMMRFVVDVFEYYSNASFSLEIGGYNYYPSPQWINEFAKLRGSTAQNQRVRFGHDGSKCCIVIGETTSSWHYPKISVRDFQAGYSNSSIDKWDDGWSISILSDLTGYTFTGSISDPLIDSKRTIYLDNHDLDDLGDGTTYGRLLKTDISSGHIKLTSNVVASGQWYDESGVEIDATHGINIYGQDAAFTTRATKTGTIQCKVDASGAIVAGGGNVLLNADGLELIATSTYDPVKAAYKLRSSATGNDIFMLTGTSDTGSNVDNHYLYWPNPDGHASLVYIGNYGSSSMSAETRIYSDTSTGYDVQLDLISSPITSEGYARISGQGLIIGSTITNIGQGRLRVDDYITALGGIHVGGTSDPGTDNLVVDGDITIASGKAIYSGYNSNYILRDHGNSNVTLSAAGGKLYIGYQNTTAIYASGAYLAVPKGVYIGNYDDPGVDNLVVDGKVGIGTT